ncbi:MAG: F0F1 ATP synthase subunit delta [Spirochaetaceae bacterium]|jgi:F-type H+-transporting ATPase subunit delta|nr:F0F1 ATP synthase subunit delta [Spirochaetaceae bacterium]
MFRAKSWADAFVGFTGETGAGPALEFLRLLCRSALSLPGYLSGQADADRLRNRIDRALKRAGEESGAALAAGSFLLLMIRRNRLAHYKVILKEIENRIDRDRGMAELFLEIPFQPGEEFIALVKERALPLAGVQDLHIRVRLMPELIGGLRLRLGSRIFDGSLKTRLEQMTQDLGGEA